MIYTKWNEDLAFVFGFPFYCEFIHSVAIGVIIFVRWSLPSARLLLGIRHRSSSSYVFRYISGHIGLLWFGVICSLMCWSFRVVSICLMEFGTLIHSSVNFLSGGDRYLVLWNKSYDLSYLIWQSLIGRSFPSWREHIREKRNAVTRNLYLFSVVLQIEFEII